MHEMDVQLSPDPHQVSMVQEVPLYPLLVKVQSIDIQKLEFKSGAPRNKHVTCIEASNYFLFLGCISGTVYVYSRKELTFLYIIPFKGGKVCNISCSENEEDVAVGSVRGIISVFRISPTNTRNPHSTTTSFLKHLCTVSHHDQNEITEIIWSPNGRFLFVGDNRGLISQVDVGTYDEFSTNIPSKVILKLKSRIIQLSFIFPYLAVSTIVGVYLCDVENEQFTRIQVKPKIDLKSTGVCLVYVKTSQPSLPSLQVFVGEANTGNLHSFDMEGVRLSSNLVNTSAISARKPVKLFDPMINGDLVQDCKSQIGPERNRVLGKLYVTDDGFIVSTCHDNCVYILEPSQVQLVLWSEEFSRINNYKIVSNYMFIGSGTQIKVVSLTQFRTYGEQLLKASLNQVVQNWIKHSLEAIGCHSRTSNECCTINSKLDKIRNCECDTFDSKILFQKFLGNFADDDFSHLVAHHLPFNLTQKEEPEEPKVIPKAPNQFVAPLNNFVAKLRSHIEELENDDLQNEPAHHFIKDISDVFETLARLYEVQTLLPMCSAQPTLSEILTSIKKFYKQTTILMTNEDFKASISEISSANLNLLSELATDYIVKLVSVVRPLHLDGCNLISPHVPMFFSFTNFASQHFVRDWFGTFYFQPNEFYDCILADSIIFLMPFVSSDKRAEIWNEVLPTSFFSWLVYLTFYSPEVDGSDEILLRALVSKNQASPNFSNEIILSIYRDLLRSTISPVFKFLHHYISGIYFILKLGFEGENCKEMTLKLLLSCLPLKHWSEDEIEQKLRDSCNETQILLNMLSKACLLDDESIKLCNCGFPVDSGHSENHFIPTSQRAMEETILKLLIENYDSKPGNTELSRPGFKFAMQRSLFQAFLTIPSIEITEETCIEIILRTNSCTLLQNLRVTKNTITTLLQKRSEFLTQQFCSSCGEAFLNSGTGCISDDCVGLWIVSSCPDLNKILNLLQKCELNTPGQFSVKFYQLLLKSGQIEKKSGNDANRKQGRVCAALH